MVILSENCPRKEINVRDGNGLISMKELASQEALYGHDRLFAHITVNPGCSIGNHSHVGETEFFYVLKGVAVLNDDGVEVTLHPGDISATGHGAVHGLENRTDEPVEIIALIAME